MNTPLVSAIVPLFNGGAFIAEALASIASQTYAPFEVILVDNGSTDDGPDISRAWAGSPPPNVVQAVFIAEARRGAGAARSAGVLLASGAYVAFLDHDDAWFPDKTRIHVAYLEAHPDVALVASRLVNVVQPSAQRPDRVTADHRLGEALSFNAGATTIRRSAFDRVGLQSGTMAVAEDIDWLMRAKSAGLEFGTTDDVVLMRRLHGGNLTNDAQLKRTHFLAAVKRQLDRQRAGERGESTRS